MGIIADRLKAIRERLGLSQKDFAASLGLSKSTYNNYETGIREPRSDVLTMMADRYDTTVDYIMGRSNNPAPRPLTLTPDEQRIGRAYGKASPPVQRTVEVALEPYMDNTTIKKAPAITEGAEIAAELHVLDAEPPRIIQLFDLPSSAGDGLFLDSSDYKDIEVGHEVPPSADFGVRISGRSMEPKYPDKYIAWVKMTSAIDDGQVGVFSVNSTGYIKKQGVGELISLNPDYDDVPLGEYDNVRTYGLVVGVSENVYE